MQHESLFGGAGGMCQLADNAAPRVAAASESAEAVVQRQSLGAERAEVFIAGQMLIGQREGDFEVAGGSAAGGIGDGAKLAAVELAKQAFDRVSSPLISLIERFDLRNQGGGLQFTEGSRLVAALVVNSDSLSN